MGVNSIEGRLLVRLFEQIAARTSGPDPHTGKSSPKSEGVARTVQETGTEKMHESEAPREVASRPKLARTQLRMEEDLKRVVAQLFDENHDLIKQVPPEELLALARRFHRFQALLFDKRA